MESMIKTTIFTLIATFLFFSFGLRQGAEQLKPSNDHASFNGGVYYQPKSDAGRTVFMQYCLSCHQREGNGVPGMYPPLKKSDWVNGDKSKLIKVLINGLDADIEVNGTPYSQSMPKFDYLTDQQIADVLTYLRQNFDNHSDPVKINEVSASRAKKMK
jgi:mono/diheme cytochrome c family protein